MRRDPYWDQLWAPGSQANWGTSQGMRARQSIDGDRVNKRFLLDEKTALLQLSGNTRRQERMNLSNLMRHTMENSTRMIVWLRCATNSISWTGQ